MSEKEKEIQFNLQIVFNKYSIIRQIGKGSFGTVFAGINTKTNEKVAIKTEVQTDKPNLSLLESESHKLNSLRNSIGIPKIYEFGKVDGFNILVMEQLGKSLNQLFISQNRKFSLKTVCVLGIDMLKIIQHVHSKKQIHRDIKPDNYMMGRDNTRDTLYLIDFGLAKRYILSNGQHIPYKTGKSMTGTARYCSIYTHQGIEQSRRDDLESIGYVLLFFLRGNLPWQGIKAKSNDKHYEKIGNVKQNTSIQDLCNGFPNELCDYFNYVKQLEFVEEPDYNLLIQIFENILKKYCDCKYVNNGVNNSARHNLFDWNIMGNLLESPKKGYKKKRDSTIGFSSIPKRRSIINNGGNSEFEIEVTHINNNNNEDKIKNKNHNHNHIHNNHNDNYKNEHKEDKKNEKDNKSNKSENNIKEKKKENEENKQNKNDNNKDNKNEKENNDDKETAVDNNGKKSKKESGTHCKCQIF